MRPASRSPTRSWWSTRSSSDLRVVREKIDDNNVRVGSLTQELDALRQSVHAAAAPRPPSAADGEPLPACRPPALAPRRPARRSGAARSRRRSPQKLFESARADYYAGQFDLAVLGFERSSRASRRSDRRRRRAGPHRHRYFQAGKYRQGGRGLRHGRSAPTRQSSVVPDAYVQEGHGAADLKEVDRASRQLQKVVRGVSRQQCGHPRQAAARPIEEAVAASTVDQRSRRLLDARVRTTM